MATSSNTKTYGKNINGIKNNQNRWKTTKKNFKCFWKIKFHFCFQQDILHKYFQNVHIFRILPILSIQNNEVVGASKHNKSIAQVPQKSESTTKLLSLNYFFLGINVLISIR